MIGDMECRRPYATILSICLLLTLLLTLPVCVQAQTDLTRISAVERSDGEGFVVRYHLSEPVDSFRVHQPAPDLIQMKLYAAELDTSNVRLPDSGSAIEEVRLHQIEDGFGADIRLGPNTYFTANAYPDQNRNDLLLALTNSSRVDILELTEGAEKINWGNPADEPMDLVSVSDINYFDDDAYMQIHENLNFDTVVIDAGHGGRDPGTIGHGGIREKEITLAVAKKLGDYINEYLPDINVVYTREDDTFVELQERGRIANQARGDLFVSIHANAHGGNRNVQGAEVYFLGLARSHSALEVMKRENSVVRYENGDGIDELSEEDLIIYELANAGNLTISERIAEKVEHQFRERAQRRSRGVKQAQFVVLYHASMPALLVELGFVTNPSEAQFLSSEYGQSIVASALFRAIRDYKDEYERSRNLTRTE